MGAALGLREPQRLGLCGGQVSLQHLRPGPPAWTAVQCPEGAPPAPDPAPARSAPQRCPNRPPLAGARYSRLLIIRFWSLEAPQRSALHPSLAAAPSQAAPPASSLIGTELPSATLASVAFLVGRIFYAPVDVTRSFERYFPPTKSKRKPFAWKAREADRDEVLLTPESTEFGKGMAVPGGGVAGVPSSRQDICRWSFLGDYPPWGPSLLGTYGL